MSNILRVALLCNNKMAYPALQQMKEDGVLCAIATTDRDPEIVHLFSQMANEYNVPYHKITEQGYREQLQNWLETIQPDAVFVMTFPWKMSGKLLNMPPKGFFNFHYGLLPEMRGADPIFESIRNQKADAGITVHVMDEGLDTGPIVSREQFPLSPELTYGMLCQQMAFNGKPLCANLIKQLKSNEPVKTEVQNEQNAKYWPKLKVEQISIRWDEMDVAAIKALVRACNPISKGTPVSLNNWKMGICEVTDVNLDGDASAITPGTILALDHQNGLIVCCKGGKALRLDIIYTDQGILPGYKLAMWGIAAGMKFEQI